MRIVAYPPQVRSIRKLITAMNTKKVCFCGDFCLAADAPCAEILATPIDPWSGLRGTFDGDTVIIANLECPFTLEPNGLPFKWANLKASPELHWTLDGLSMAVLGNNHIADFGLRGARDTQALLAAKGISCAGYGETLGDALKPAFLDLGGHRLGVVSLCCPTTDSENLATHLTPGVAPLLHSRQELTFNFDRQVNYGPKYYPPGLVKVAHI